MVSITLSVPAELKHKMDQHDEIKWSSVVRAIISEQLESLEEVDRIAKKSKLTQKDVDELARSIDEGMAKRWKALVG